jgi:cysteine synthase A
MLFEAPHDIVLDDIFLKLDGFAHGTDLALKLEGLNPAGSVKLKTAVALIDDAEAGGRLRPGGRVIESSSGNLGVALSMLAAARGYRFTCVTDQSAQAAHITAMRRLGAEVVIVTRRDRHHGYLGERIRYIRERLREDPSLVWPNQYANLANRDVHRDTTAAAILREFGRVDFLFAGAGTTGTLMGCAQLFRRRSPGTRIIAVDAAGSVTFGDTPRSRHIPGLGTSRRPEIARPEDMDDVLFIEEPEAVETCREVAVRYGLLVGGSTGSVLAGVRRYADRFSRDAVVVAISPDLGDRYLDTVYSDAWVDEKYGLDGTRLTRPAL